MLSGSLLILVPTLLLPWPLLLSSHNFSWLCLPPADAFIPGLSAFAKFHFYEAVFWFLLFPGVFPLAFAFIFGEPTASVSSSFLTANAWFLPEPFPQHVHTVHLWSTFHCSPAPSSLSSVAGHWPGSVAPVQWLSCWMHSNIVQTCRSAP